MSNTEATVDNALNTDRPTDSDTAGGVWTALSALFTNRGHVLVRHELHLDAARATTHRHLHRRSQTAIARLLAAVLAEAGHDTSDQAVIATLVGLDEANALDVAVRHQLARTYVPPMAKHLDRTLRPEPQR